MFLLDAKHFHGKQYRPKREIFNWDGMFLLDAKHFHGKQYRPKREILNWDGMFLLDAEHFHGKQYRPKRKKPIWDGSDRPDQNFQCLVGPALGSETHYNSLFLNTSTPIPEENNIQKTLTAILSVMRPSR